MKERHPRIIDEDPEEEEVTEVTLEMQQFRADAEACKEAALETIRASDSLVKSLTPAPPEPAPHRHEKTCWISYDVCGEHHQHDYNCGSGDLSVLCPEEAARRNAPTEQKK